MTFAASFQTETPPENRLAKAVGVTAAAVVNWETGKSFPRQGALVKIARALNVSEQSLTNGAPGRKSKAEVPTVSARPGKVQKVTDARAIIASAKRQIAGATGVSVKQVKIFVEYEAA